jgi:hypothetical protein
LALGACGDESTTTTSTATTTGTAGAVRRAFDAALMDNLVHEQHLSRARASCIVRKLDRTLSYAQIQHVAKGKFYRPIAKRAGQAGISCKRR